MRAAEEAAALASSVNEEDDAAAEDAWEGFAWLKAAEDKAKHDAAAAEAAAFEAAAEDARRAGTLADSGEPPAWTPEPSRTTAVRALDDLDDDDGEGHDEPVAGGARAVEAALPRGGSGKGAAHSAALQAALASEASFGMGALGRPVASDSTSNVAAALRRETTAASAWSTTSTRRTASRPPSQAASPKPVAPAPPKAAPVKAAVHSTVNYSKWDNLDLDNDDE